MDSVILGYLGALVVGLTLGLLGGGGSILTVPIMVYLIGVNPVLATAYSLFVVGVTSLVGAIKQARNKLVDYRIAVVFAIPAFIAVYLTRRYMLPAIPEVIFETDTFSLSKDIAIMVFFAIIMLMAGISMIRGRKEQSSEQSSRNLNYPIIILEGLVVGVITGMVGAGGGFLIIPALVILAKLPIKRAIATSLMIIAVKSLIGFLGDVQTLVIDWGLLLKFTLISIIGIFLGMYLNHYIDGKKLKAGFGWFVLVMAGYILARELFA